MAEARFEKLTAGHMALMDEVREEWIGHGLSTAPADRRAAVAGVHDSYRAAGLAPPQDVVWVDSPLEGANYFYRLCARLGGDDEIRVKGLLHDYIHVQFEDRFDADVRAAVDKQVGRPVDDRVIRLVLCVEARLKAEADPVINPRRFPGRQWTHCVRGQFEAGTLSDYDMYTRLGAEPCGRVAGIMHIARSAGMWWSLRHVVVLSERPAELHHDGRGRPHRENGPAIVYPDGWGVYVWHGVHVPADLIEGDGWSIEKVLKEPDSEIRRCAVERIAAVRGWPELVHRAGWRQIGRTVSDPGNPDQTLSMYRVPHIYDVTVNLLLMTNGTTERDGTRRQYAETVPAHLTDPVAAAAWQIGLSGEHYRQTVRRT
jgi:hypothetical protein